VPGLPTAAYPTGIIIPNYKQRAIRLKCGVPDIMDHIFTNCDAPGQKIIWDLAKQLWQKKGLQWPEPELS
jgi:hypothetical protein